MKKKIQTEGISCGGCVTRVKRALEAYPAIVETQIFLHPKGATIISMKEELSVAELQEQLNELEGYTITEVN